MLLNSICPGCHATFDADHKRAYEIIQTVNREGDKRVILYACSIGCARKQCNAGNQRNAGGFIGKLEFRRSYHGGGYPPNAA